MDRLAVVVESDGVPGANRFGALAAPAGVAGLEYASLPRCDWRGGERVADAAAHAAGARVDVVGATLSHDVPAPPSHGQDGRRYGSTDGTAAPRPSVADRTRRTDRCGPRVPARARRDGRRRGGPHAPPARPCSCRSSSLVVLAVARIVAAVLARVPVGAVAA